jgi:hypothetical protein
MTSVSAPVLSHQQVARSLKAKTNKPVKNTLCTPYKVLWRPVEGPTQDAMLNELKKCFAERDLMNPLSESSAYRRLKKDERRSKKDEYLAELKRSPEDDALRRQLVFGVTEITRALEKGTLRLVMVDRSSPWQLHRHLAQLSVVRGCPALALDRMSDTLSSFVSLTRMCALGFKVKSEGDSQYFDGVVEFIVARCPPIELPWLDCENTLLALKEEAAENKQLEEKDLLEVEGSSKTKLSDDVVNETKGYSYLYIKKSSQIPNTEPRNRTVSDNCNFSNDVVFDDIWGLDESRNRLQDNSGPSKFVFDTAGSKTFSLDNQDASKSVKKSKKSKKRAYSELNIEPVFQNQNKKKKKSKK